MILFLDTSALVKLFHAEQGTVTVLDWFTFGLRQNIETIETGVSS